MTEVRITHLCPREIRERLTAQPVGWLPLGTLEWHGYHAPLGLDGLLAESLSMLGASRLGGVAFPPVYYGDHRGVIVEALAAPGGWEQRVPLSFDHRIEACQELGVSPGGVEANALRDQARGAGPAYVELIERAFWMARAYGVTRIIAVLGHGGTFQPARLAAERFNAAQSVCQAIPGGAHDMALRGGCPPDSELADFDHGGRWETSQLLHFRPEVVKMSRLAENLPGEPLGIYGRPEDASAELGERIADAFVKGCSVVLADVPPMTPLPTPDEDGVEGDWVETVGALMGAPDPEEAFISGMFAPQPASE